MTDLPPSLPPSLGLNVYDIRIPCEVPGLCYDFSNVETFLQDPEVRREEGKEGGREGGCEKKWGKNIFYDVSWW